MFCVASDVRWDLPEEPFFLTVPCEQKVPGMDKKNTKKRTNHEKEGRLKPSNSVKSYAETPLNINKEQLQMEIYMNYRITKEKNVQNHSLTLSRGCHMNTTNNSPRPTPLTRPVGRQVIGCPTVAFGIPGIRPLCLPGSSSFLCFFFNP